MVESLLFEQFLELTGDDERWDLLARVARHLEAWPMEHASGREKCVDSIYRICVYEPAHRANLLARGWGPFIKHGKPDRRQRFWSTKFGRRFAVSMRSINRGCFSVCKAARFFGHLQRGCFATTGTRTMQVTLTWRSSSVIRWLPTSSR